MGLGRLAGRFSAWDLAKFRMSGRSEADLRAPWVYVQSRDGNLPSGGWKDIFIAVPLVTQSGAVCVMNAFSGGGCPSYLVLL